MAMNGLAAHLPTFRLTKYTVLIVNLLFYQDEGKPDNAGVKG
jgi:hypothetical protein